jgi:hypothetical protein
LGMRGFVAGELELRPRRCEGGRRRRGLLEGHAPGKRLWSVMVAIDKVGDIGARYRSDAHKERALGGRLD